MKVGFDQGVLDNWKKGVLILWKVVFGTGGWDTGLQSSIQNAMQKNNKWTGTKQKTLAPKILWIN